LNKANLFNMHQFRPALIAGLTGAGLGILSGDLVAIADVVPPNLLFNGIPFQNFAIALRAGCGMLMGIAAYFLFLITARRDHSRYGLPTAPAARIGGVAGLLGLVVNTTIYFTAPSFGMVRENTPAFMVDIIGFSLSSGAMGLAAGYLAVQIWGRNLNL
jgi:hypothetical protein